VAPKARRGHAERPDRETELTSERELRIGVDHEYPLAAAGEQHRHVDCGRGLAHPAFLICHGTDHHDTSGFVVEKQTAKGGQDDDAGRAAKNETLVADVLRRLRARAERAVIEHRPRRPGLHWRT
jgi:hypothetical protein